MVLANANELSIFKFGWHFVRYRNVEIIHGIILITHIWIFGFDQSLRTCFEEWNVACPLEILFCQITQCFLFFFCINREKCHNPELLKVRVQITKFEGRRNFSKNQKFLKINSKPSLPPKSCFRRDFLCDLFIHQLWESTARVVFVAS